MCEPACRGGSKRSLNISNPTPKWPRSPGEMVSAPARAADTPAHTRALTLTHTRTHAHAAGSPRPPPRRPRRLGAIPFFFLFLFLFHVQFACAGLPAAPGKHTLIPAGSFRSCWVLLGPQSGRAGLAPPPRLFRGAEPGTRRAAAGGPGVQRGARKGRGRPRRPARGSLRFPGRAEGPRLGLRRPALPPAGRKLTQCSVRDSSVGRSPRPPPHSTWARAAERGAFRGSEPREDGKRCRGARASTRRGRGEAGRALCCGSLPTQCRRTGRRVAVLLPDFIPHLFSQHMHPSPPQAIYPPRVVVPRPPRSRSGRFPGWRAG